jgi:hypothetical protein
MLVKLANGEDEDTSLDEGASSASECAKRKRPESAVTVPVHTDPKHGRTAMPRLAGWLTGETHLARSRAWQRPGHPCGYSRGAPHTNRGLGSEGEGRA